MYIVGLTGNIATGKTTIARMLEDMGAFRIDADRVAHQALQPGTETYHRVIARFGTDITTDDGEIDRARLGKIVFHDAGALADLEGVVHPFVIQEIARLLHGCDSDVVVIEAIKLLEARLHTFCDAVWVVTATRQVQLARLVKNRGMEPAEAAQRIDAQPPQEAKIERADCVIDNSGSLEATREQVERAASCIPGLLSHP